MKHLCTDLEPGVVQVGHGHMGEVKNEFKRPQNTKCAQNAQVVTEEERPFLSAPDVVNSSDNLHRAGCVLPLAVQTDIDPEYIVF